MDGNLIELATSKLLDKFGAGAHKPGSGSAAAFQGLLAAQLIRTVIDLTDDEKRRHYYSKGLPKLRKIRKEVEEQIYPDLIRLFQIDSDQFDEVISLRKARDREPNPIKKSRLADEALEALKQATEIPISIAKQGITLAEHAAVVFDNGFTSARGDSGVALNAALSSVSGCLSIIELNLLSLIDGEWIDKIKPELAFLKARYKALYAEAMARQEVLETEVNQTRSLHSDLHALRSGIKAKPRLTNSDIEDVATQLQNAMWRHRNRVWKKETPGNPLEVLKPEAALKKLGYQFLQPKTLGQHEVQGELLEIAGLIDKPNKYVAISKQFPPETLNFTAAHELGHALLHEDMVQHRDRPLDGSALSLPRDIKELQADKFASYFLMPKKQVIKMFQALFFMEKFVITEETTLALNEGRVKELRKKCKDLRGLARLLASTEYFGGKLFQSMAKQFSVSVEAMAIRLEELDLLEY